MQHDIIRFKVGLNREISSHLTLHKFETVVEVFQAAMEIEKDNKERSAYKVKIQQGSSLRIKKEVIPLTSDWLKNKSSSSSPSSQISNNQLSYQPPKLEVKLNALPISSKGFQCFKCQGWDHRASECATRRNVILRDGRLYYLSEEVELEI